MISDFNISGMIFDAKNLAMTEGHMACIKLSSGMLTWLPVRSECRFAYGPADVTATHYRLLQYEGRSVSNAPDSLPVV